MFVITLQGNEQKFKDDKNSVKKQGDKAEYLQKIYVTESCVTTHR